MKNTVIFNSITEIPGWIAGRPVPGRENDSERHPPQERFDRGLGYEGAIEAARNGGWWEEGASDIMEAHTYMEELKHAGREDDLINEVAGFAPDVDAYIAGQPDSMLDIEEQESERKPIVSIGVQLYQPYGTSAEELFNRGAAILSVIDDLENRGYRVELWGCVYGLNRKDKSKESGIDMRCCLKQAHDDWSPSSVAFGLCHSAFGRRLGWRVAEAFANNHNRGYFPTHAIRTSNSDQPAGAEFDIWFSYMDVSHSAYSRKETALERVSSIINDGLKQLTEYRAAA